MLTRHRFLSAVVLTALLFATFGCGSPVQQPTQQPAQPPAPAAPAQPAAPQPAATPAAAPAQPAAPVKAPPESSKLSIGLPVPAISFLPVWVADKQGFFKAEGLSDVKVLSFRGDADVLQALASGTTDINVSSLTGLILSIDSGQKYKSIWAGYNMSLFEFYAQPKFKSIAETKGGRYAVTKYGALTDFLTRHALRTAGLDPDKDVKILQLGGSPQSMAAMESGQIEATILSHPTTYVAQEKGFVKLAGQKETVAEDWPTHVVFAKEEYLAKHPNTMKAFLRAQGRAMDWIKANPDKAAEIAVDVAKFKLEHARKAIDAIAYGWFPDGRLPQKDKGMKVFWEIAVQAGDVKEAWPDSKWLDDSFLKTQSEWRK